MHFSAALSTARAKYSFLVPHVLAWFVCGVSCFATNPNRLSSDTKLDLVIDPAHFLAGALQPWSNIFPLGQMQNQAYGYLFPQGFFFLLGQWAHIPAWITQRLWWWLILGLAWSGFWRLSVAVLGRIPHTDDSSVWKRLWLSTPHILAATAYAYSPRMISTLGAISSESWAVALAPWIVVPLYRHTRARTHTWASVAASLLAVGCLGAVNATATLAACVPAGLVLIWGMWRRRTRLRTLLVWCVGVCAVSVWWIGPLLILGKYSPPFTDYIESAATTTRWLNVVEVLRGTTQWVPFVDTERISGYTLVSSPLFVVLTLAVAGSGLAGLWLMGRREALWPCMAVLGFVIFLGAPHVTSWLDTSSVGVALRNVHKFDPVLRMPLSLGVGAICSVMVREEGSGARRRKAVCIVLVLLTCGATSPAWSAQLAPLGSFHDIPSSTRKAAEWLNTHAGRARTLILPEASFARQTWGWTRDEPLQPLLRVPWVTRDAIPLLPSETIRLLDSITSPPDILSAVDTLRRMGIGYLFLRHDLEDASARDRATLLENAVRDAGLETHHFSDDLSDVTVVSLGFPEESWTLLDAPTSTLTTVSGAGEATALVDRVFSPNTSSAYPMPLLFSDPSSSDIITDTPLAVERTFGRLSSDTTSAVSAPLANDSERKGVHPHADYASAAQAIGVTEIGGTVTASSSRDDSTALAGTDPAHSVTAAVDGDDRTSWYPALGAHGPHTLTLHAQGVESSIRSVVVSVTQDADVTIDAQNSADLSTHRQAHLTAQESTSLALDIPLDGPTVDVTITVPDAVGVAEIALPDHPITRSIVLPDASPDTHAFLFSQLTVPTGVLHRVFSASRDAHYSVRCSDTTSVDIDGAPYPCGSTLTLPAGKHTVASDADWVGLVEEGWSPATIDASQVSPISDSQHVESADHERILVLHQAYNAGTTARLGTISLQPLSVDGGLQAFSIPANISGELHVAFTATALYRSTLFGGGCLWCILMLVFLGTVLRHRRPDTHTEPPLPDTLHLQPSDTRICGLIIALVALSALWYERAPWPSSAYAGDEFFVSVPAALACCLAVASVFYGGRRNVHHR